VLRESWRGEDSVVAWLLDGDPAIRWQVMRDLLDEPPETWQAERRRFPALRILRVCDGA
jgi:hypothetical protein